MARSEARDKWKFLRKSFAAPKAVKANHSAAGSFGPATVRGPIKVALQAMNFVSLGQFKNFL